MVDVVGYLCYLFLLQCFGHVYQVGGVPLLARGVEVSHVAQSHDVSPVEVFLEDIEHLVLPHYVFKHVGIGLARDAQKQTVVVLHNVEQLDKPSARHEVSVVVVHGVAQRVIIGIERAAGLE